MRDVYISGAGMTRFGKYPDRSLKDLAREALDATLNDDGRNLDHIEAAYVANSVAGIVTGQEAIRGQTVLHAYGLGGIPVYNIENACASSSTAAHLAWQAVSTGIVDTALVLGVEKLFHPDRSVSYRALASATDIEEHPSEEGSPFLRHAADAAADFLERVGGDQRTLAQVAEKAHFHGSLNPYAQYQDVYTTEDILESPTVVGSLTRLMCAPIGDGAAAVILSGNPPSNGEVAVRIAGIAVGSATAGRPERPMAERIAERAYEMAGIKPDNLDVVELHDTTAFNELRLYEQLGLVDASEMVAAVENGTFGIGGATTVNPSGGLLSRGHPVGASGVAQLVELTWQLRGTAERRQVESARWALAQNGGGRVGDEPAAMAVTVLEGVAH